MTCESRVWQPHLPPRPSAPPRVRFLWIGGGLYVTVARKRIIHFGSNARLLYTLDNPVRYILPLRSTAALDRIHSTLTLERCVRPLHSTVTFDRYTSNVTLGRCTRPLHAARLACLFEVFACLQVLCGSGGNENTRDSSPVPRVSPTRTGRYVLLRQRLTMGREQRLNTHKLPFVTACIALFPFIPANLICTFASLGAGRR